MASGPSLLNISSDSRGKTARAFLWRAAMAAGAGALAIAIMNAAVDPLNLFQRDAPSWLGCAPGFRIDEPYALGLAVKSRRPEVILTGTSRVRGGQEAGDPALSAAGAHAFNFGLAAASMSTIERHVGFATDEYAPAALVVGLSLGSFLPPFPGSDTATEPVTRLRAWVRNLLSSTATEKSIASVVDVRRCRDAARSPAGDGPLLPKWPGEPGRAQAVHAVDATFAVRYATAAGEIRRDKRKTGLEDRQLAAFSTLLARECARGTRVLLFFEPSHVRLLEMIRAAGLWNDYEALKRHVTAAVAQARQAGCAADLTDFTGYDRYTSESLDRTEVTYFWESSHYTHALGRVITRRLVGAEEPGDDFGRRLTPEMLEAHLARLRAQRDRFVTDNPGVVEHVGRLLATAHAR